MALAGLGKSAKKTAKREQPCNFGQKKRVALAD
jgi:hypothetical protein